jgi:integrase
MARKHSNWTFNNILKFIQFHNTRVVKKEISGATVRNYVKSIKLFCDMADLPIAWKKITRGLPKGRQYANDRIPTLEELTKLLEYPDRRIKAIVCTMASSGMRELLSMCGFATNHRRKKKAGNRPIFQPAQDLC